MLRPQKEGGKGARASLFLSFFFLSFLFSSLLTVSPPGDNLLGLQGDINVADLGIVVEELGNPCALFRVTLGDGAVPDLDGGVPGASHEGGALELEGRDRVIVARDGVQHPAILDGIDVNVIIPAPNDDAFPVSGEGAGG